MASNVATIKLHDLKTWPEFFGGLWAGAKTFEIRRDDRGFVRGDVLLLREWHARGGYTGRLVVARVTYVLPVAPGLEPGFVLLSIREVARGVDGDRT